MKTTEYQVGIKAMPVSERPRERMQQEGPQALSSAELIGILLSSGTQKMSAVELGQLIVSHQSEGLAFLKNCTIEELCAIKGVGMAKACKILAALELGKRVSAMDRHQRFKIRNPEDISRLVMEDMRFLQKEKFYILLLNTKHEVLHREEISVGSLNASIVHPREVFLAAIKKSCSSIILVHNHPSGDPTPSKEDVLITKRLIDAGRIIGIAVLDHVIVGDNIFSSLREMDVCTFD